MKSEKFNIHITRLNASRRDLDEYIAKALGILGVTGYTIGAGDVHFHGNVGDLRIFYCCGRLHIVQQGDDITVSFCHKLSLNWKGYALALVTCFLAALAFQSGQWFLVVELAAVAGATLMAVEYRQVKHTHAKAINVLLHIRSFY